MGWSYLCSARRDFDLYVPGGEKSISCILRSFEEVVAQASHFQCVTKAAELVVIGSCDGLGMNDVIHAECNPITQPSHCLPSMYYVHATLHQSFSPPLMALKNFDPEALLQNWDDQKFSPLHNGKTLAQSLREAFGIPRSDTYVYRALAETTLGITQRAIDAKRAHGLHGWYHDDDGNPVCDSVLASSPCTYI